MGLRGKVLINPVNAVPSAATGNEGGINPQIFRRPKEYPAGHDGSMLFAVHKIPLRE
jgi:hypothetical protein